MIKKIIIACSLLLAILGTGYWYVYIKEKPLVDDSLYFCFHVNKRVLYLSSMDGREYLSSVDSKNVKDTLILLPATTTIYNPFALNKIIGVYVDPEVFYIKTPTKVISIMEVNRCL